MAKTFYGLFAIVSYALFFATFLYLIAFVGDFALVPKTVDNGFSGNPITSFIADVALIALFGLQHSVMARRGSKQVMAGLIPKPVERSVYVLVSSAVLIILFGLWQPIEGDIWRIDSPVLRALIWGLFGAGWLIVLFSTFLLNHFELFGLQQVYLHARGRPAADPQLRQPLFYKIVRHPLYSGFFIAFWATPHMTVGHLVLATGMSIYMLVGIRYEERDMVDTFGTDYTRYREHVGMLTPRLKRVRGGRLG